MKGILKREAGTGRSIWLVQPTDNTASSIIVDFEDCKDFTDADLGREVDYNIVDIGHKFFKKEHYQEWLLAKINK